MCVSVCARVCMLLPVRKYCVISNTETCDCVLQASRHVLHVPGTGPRLHLFTTRRQRHAFVFQPAADQTRRNHVQRIRAALEQ